MAFLRPPVDELSFEERQPDILTVRIISASESARNRLCMIYPKRFQYCNLCFLNGQLYIKKGGLNYLLF